MRLEGRNLDRVIHGQAKQHSGQIARRAGIQALVMNTSLKRRSRSRQACGDDRPAQRKMTIPERPLYPI